MTIRESFGIVLRRLPSVLAFAIVGALVSLGYTLTAPKSYTATAQSFVALTGASEDQSNPLNAAQFAAQRVKSYTEIVSSPDVLQPVISELGLSYSTQQLASMVSATNPPQTVLLLVSANSGSASESALIANATSVQLGRVIEELETPTAQSVPPVKVTLTDPATPPTAATSPKLRINLAIGIFLGLAVGVAWAFARDALDNTIKTSEELDTQTGTPTLGTVLFDPDAKSRVLTALDTKLPESEGYRRIRANLQYVNVDNPARALVVTSAEPGDGKTTVACNLAIALAQAGRKVCLVEADLRRPRVSEYLQLNAQTGLTEVLAGQIKLDEALQEWGRGMLQVLPPGAIPPNPSELLGSHQMAQVIVNLKRDFDVVILDTPPLLAVSDAAVLASQADGAVVVVRHGKSSKDAVRNAVASLDRINAKILGTVLNAVPAKRGGSYGYGYGYGYGDSKAPSDNKAPANQQGA